VNLAEIRVEPREEIMLVTVSGEVDMSNARELAAAVWRRMGNDQHGLVLDLSEVRYLDSAGIHAIFELHERLRERGQDMRLVVPAGSPIAGAVTLVDMERSIGVAQSVEAAEAQIHPVPEKGSAPQAPAPRDG
jgi:anti-anti-sigma factor